MLSHHVKGDALEEATEVGAAIAAALNDLELVVHALDEAAGLPRDEVVGDLFTPGRKRAEQAVEATQTALGNLSLPGLELGQALVARGRCLKDRGQVLPKLVGQFQVGCALKQTREPSLFVGFEVLRALPKRPERMLDLFQHRLVLGRPQATQGRFAQRIGTVAVPARDVKAVGHNRRVGQHVLGGVDGAFPQVGADGGNRVSPCLGDALEPGDDGGFQSVRQQGQHPHLAILKLGRYHGDTVAMPFEQGNLVNPKYGKGADAVPVNAGGNPGVQDAQNGIVADVFLAHHILNGAVDQGEEQVALLGNGVQRPRVIPIQSLGCGRTIVAIRTAETLGPNADVDHSAEDGQMAQEDGLIDGVFFGKQAPTVLTVCRRQGAFHRDDELVLLA